MRNYILSIILILFVPTSHTTASWNECEETVKNILNTEREKQIIDLISELTITKTLQNCENYQSSIIATIHEGVHYIDTMLSRNVTYEELLKNPYNQKIDMKLFLTNQEELILPKVKLPTPLSILEQNNNNWKFSISNIDTKMEFLSMYENYISEDMQMLSSRKFFDGFGTELNAYSHGLLTSWNLLAKDNNKPDFNKMLYFTQKSGVVFFITITSIYLETIKQNDQTLWKQITSDLDFIYYLDKLIGSSLEALEVTKSCEHDGKVNKEWASIFDLLYKDASLSFLNINTSKNYIKNMISCN